ncbi:hypothetical protein MHYP_G00069470 [Metynnis hypsauchen]
MAVLLFILLTDTASNSAALFKVFVVCSNLMQKLILNHRQLNRFSIKGVFCLCFQDQIIGSAEADDEQDHWRLAAEPLPGHRLLSSRAGRRAGRVKRGEAMW